MKELIIRQYTDQDIFEMAEIWNEVVRDGNAFPQMNELSIQEAKAFFSEQTYCGAAITQDGQVAGMYILHPNNIGRCGHICNASYAVNGKMRNMHIGEALVKDCMKQARLAGFRILQFNAVVSTNLNARHLYEKLGFTPLGTIPGGFLMKDGHYEDIVIHYITL